MGPSTDVLKRQTATDSTGDTVVGVLDALPVGVLAFDSKLRVVFANLTARTWFPPSEFIHDMLKIATIEQDVFDWPTELREVLRGGSTRRFSATLSKQDGVPQRVVEFSITRPPNADKQNPVGIITVIEANRSVSDDRRTAINERMAAIGKIAAKVAHELNNPLDGVMRYAGLTVRRLGNDADEKALEYLENIQSGVRRMAAIVRDLLEFSRTHSDVDRPMTLTALLNEAVKSTRPNTNTINVLIDIDDSVSNTPLVNGDALHQVFCNLIKNAFDAMGNSGDLKISATPGEGATMLFFDDTGPGIGDEPDKLFKAFFTTKPKGHGTGLGLAVCRDLIESRGGTITAENRPQGGARFTVALPTGKADESKRRRGEK